MTELEVEKRTLDLMDKHGLIDAGWVFKFDRAVRRSGCCHWDKKIITISKALSTTAPNEEIVTNTILHEIAHALCSRTEGHGRAWKAKHREIGGNGNRCTTGYNYSKFNTLRRNRRTFIGVCPNCARETIRSRRNDIACSLCCRKYNNNRYSPAFKFMWQEYPRATVTFNGGKPVPINNFKVSFAEKEV